MKTTINKSEVLKRAWYLFKNQSVKTDEMFSQCLRQSWAISKTNPFDFNSFYKQYYKGLLNHVTLQLCGDVMTAEEVVNDSFMKVRDSIHTYNSDKGKLASWLYAIANNAIIDNRRKNSKYMSNVSISNEIYEGHEYMQIADNQISVEEQVENVEKSEIIRRIINNSLNANQKRMSELRFINEYTYDEISAEMGISIDTVKVTLFRAKKILQRELLKAKLHPAKV